MIAKAAMFATCITLACFFPQLFKHKPDYMEAMQRTYFICVGALLWVVMFGSK